jgi:hypothetical protein
MIAKGTKVTPEEGLLQDPRVRAKEGEEANPEEGRTTAGGALLVTLPGRFVRIVTKIGRLP